MSGSAWDQEPFPLAQPPSHETHLILSSLDVRSNREEGMNTVSQV